MKKKTLGAQMIHRVTIEENAGNVNDGAGNIVPKWVPVASLVPAKVTPTNGAEITTADKKAAQITHIVKMRYRSGLIKDKHRVIFNGRILKIEYIINKEERNIQLDLQCKEG
ncbi:head-tail adaptor protein [Bacillus phage Silence]|jgi:SPP1 family predicted phage head-tail adaptor|nr:head-tail adaptor protein [Bacillus phage Silence]